MSYIADICASCRKQTKESRMSYCEFCEVGYCDKCLDDKNKGLLACYEMANGEDRNLCNECFRELPELHDCKED